MKIDYPKDDDGDALRLVAADGNDMSKPMDIDFAVAAPDEERAQSIAEVAAQQGYAPAIEYDDEDDAWTVTCTKNMLPSYEAIVTAQQELDQLSEEFDGFADGWGTFGNKEEK